MTESNSVVRLEKLAKAYTDGQTFYALNHVDLEIGRGERVAIMGPSGAGKSTMLNLICGLDVPTSGRVCIEGTDISQLSDDDRTRLRREKVGMIFQSFNLLPTLSALENVSLPLRLRNGSRREAEKRAREMLERVGLDRQATHRPDEMSGGECQRVAIARALVSIPRSFLLMNRLGISTQPVVKGFCNCSMNFTANSTTPSCWSRMIALRRRVANAC